MKDKIIEDAFVTVHGDPSVGIFDQQITISGLELDMNALDPLQLSDIRSDLQDAFEKIYGDPCSVMFDSETGDEMSERTAAITTLLGLSAWSLLLAYVVFMWVTG